MSSVGENPVDVPLVMAGDPALPSVDRPRFTLKEYFRRHYREVRPQFLPFWERFLLYSCSALVFGINAGMVCYFGITLAGKKYDVIVEVVGSVIALTASLILTVILLRLKAHIYEKPPASVFQHYFEARALARAAMIPPAEQPGPSDEDTSLGARSLPLDPEVSRVPTSVATSSEYSTDTRPSAFASPMPSKAM